MILKSINPFTNKVIEEFEEISGEMAEKVLTESGEAFEKWKRTCIEYRGSLMDKAAALLRSNINEYAGSITLEMGKPLKESRAEVEKCALVCEYYAKNAGGFLSPEPAKTDADISYVTFEPLGTILGIMPWNFPFWQVFRFAVPTLMAGNTVLLKHASNVQICARNIESLFDMAGFPPSVFRNLVIGSGRIDKIIKYDCISAVSLTGSESAGQKVAEAAGSVLKKCLLELGGSNAFIVLEDANIRQAAEIGIKARFQNAGQSCIAAKRFILDRRISDEFLDRFLDGIRKLKRGNPMEEETDIGPLASIGQAERVEEQVVKSVAMGARVIEGGIRDKAFYQPAVVVDVRPGMSLFDEEVFGPVAPVSICSNTAEAITMAKTTDFGLGVSLFTGDLNKAYDLAREFHDGAVFINGMVKSDQRLPFGGTRHSGFGRELALQGIREFVNIKTVWAKKL
jgi:succinate-semialdehyde dehydrogenase / glutarate-semialdehyde dehydrogenase